MTVRLNHTILAAKDKTQSARFFTELFALPDHEEAGPFAVVRLADDQLIQFAEPPVDLQMQHHAFLVDDATFDHLVARLHGGRGVYFHDAAGHALEAITAPYAD
jgi:catechol 2,3-dioxygenase-like lactoylglutathione lyase family enzyme